jgi:hypothetical protein
LGFLDKIITKRFIKTYTVASGVSASGVSQIDISNNDKDDYAPFNIVNIVNKSGQVVSLYPNGISAQQLVIPNGVDKTYTDVNFTTLTLKNLDTANATDDAVYITIQKDIGTREFLIILYKALAKIVGGA